MASTWNTSSEEKMEDNTVSENSLTAEDSGFKAGSIERNEDKCIAFIIQKEKKEKGEQRCIHGSSFIYCTGSCTYPVYK